MATCTGLSTDLARPPGSIPVNLSAEPLSVLAERIRPAMEDYLLSRQPEALALLDERSARGGPLRAKPPAGWLPAPTGQRCWRSSRGAPTRQISDDGDLLAPASDVEHPEVIDDAVDELIEMVLDRGGWVALVDDGALSARDGVALTLRSRG